MCDCPELRRIATDYSPKEMEFEPESPSAPPKENENDVAVIKPAKKKRKQTNPEGWRMKEEEGSRWREA